MFCPKCRSEYNPGISVCRDCDIALIHELQPEPEQNVKYIEYEGLFDTHNPADIAVIRSILEVENIKYYFLGEHASRYTYHAKPIRLMVKKDHAEKAKEILKDVDLSYYATGPAVDPENKESGE